MASEYTENYQLDLYASEDKPNLRDQYNSAMTKVDEALHEQAVSIGTAQTSIESQQTALTAESAARIQGVNEAKQAAQEADSKAHNANLNATNAQNRIVMINSPLCGYKKIANSDNTVTASLQLVDTTAKVASVPTGAKLGTMAFAFVTVAQTVTTASTGPISGSVADALAAIGATAFADTYEIPVYDVSGVLIGVATLGASTMSVHLKSASILNSKAVAAAPVMVSKPNSIAVED